MRETNQQLHQRINSVLHEAGYLTNKRAFFDYLHDNTDLISLKFPEIKSSFYSLNKDTFARFSWQEILVRLG